MAARLALLVVGVPAALRAAWWRTPIVAFVAIVCIDHPHPRVDIGRFGASSAGPREAGESARVGHARAALRSAGPKSSASNVNNGANTRGQ